MRWNRVLFRRWSCLILGGALLTPYMIVGVLVAGWAQRGDGAAALTLPAQLAIYAGVLPLVALTGLFLPVRELEVNAARGLLGAPVEPAPISTNPVKTSPVQAGPVEAGTIEAGPGHEPGEGRSWQERRRTSAWFTLHLAVGGLLSGCTLGIVPFTAVTLLLPFTGAPSWLGLQAEPGLRSLLWPVAGLAALALLVLMVHGAGALLARLAPALLGPTPAERLAAAEERARVLAQRNRLARELHDSVGHALSVVTLQAAAAGRVLDRDPVPTGTVRTALTAIEESACAALEDLDHVLGVLRAGDDAPRQPRATLADLDALVRSTGAEVRTRIGDLDGVPAVVSREAYRIVQEALTNAIKHGRGPVELSVRVHDGALHLEVTNRRAVGMPRPGVSNQQADDAPRPEVTDQQADSAPHAGIASGRAAGDAPLPEAGDRPMAGGRGVQGMRERAQLLGGELHAGPAADGWRVTARLPLRSEA